MVLWRGITIPTLLWLPYHSQCRHHSWTHSLHHICFIGCRGRGRRARCCVWGEGVTGGVVWYRVLCSCWSPLCPTWGDTTEGTSCSIHELKLFHSLTLSANYLGCLKTSEFDQGPAVPGARRAFTLLLISLFMSIFWVWGEERMSIRLAFRSLVVEPALRSLGLLWDIPWW